MCPDLFFFGALAPSGAPKYLTKIQISFFFIDEGNYSRRHLRNHPPFAFSCTDGPPEEELWSPYWAELVGRKGFRRVMEVMSEWQSYWKVSEPQRGEFSPCHQPHCNCGWEKGLSRHISLIYKRPKYIILNSLNEEFQINCNHWRKGLLRSLAPLYQGRRLHTSQGAFLVWDVHPLGMNARNLGVCISSAMTGCLWSFWSLFVKYLICQMMVNYVKGRGIAFFWFSP